MEINQAAPKFQDVSIAPMHTCEHIINQTMDQMFGCGRAVSAHIERKKSKLDFLLPVAPTEIQLQDLANRVNDVINQHLPIRITFLTQEEAATRFDLKRLPEGASETLRLVSIGDYDTCLCIGSHVENTSEIGKFILLNHTYEEGRLRIRFKLSLPA